MSQFTMLSIAGDAPTLAFFSRAVCSHLAARAQASLKQEKGVMSSRGRVGFATSRTASRAALLGAQPSGPKMEGRAVATFRGGR